LSKNKKDGGFGWMDIQLGTREEHLIGLENEGMGKGIPPLFNCGFCVLLLCFIPFDGPSSPPYLSRFLARENEEIIGLDFCGSDG
jgi:hypothetical protein